MTNVSCVDRRIETTPTFGQLAVRQWFECEGQVFCKVEPLLSKTVTAHYNAFNVCGGFELFDDGELVTPIEHIQIEIVK